jgi:4-amino-4-deoxy-L-arabinose transferase-like glycosyltransferase
MRSDRVLLLVILAIGIAVRVVARQSTPNGFNQDEASLGYDAWSILTYGVDRHGIAYPAFLIGWGSGMNALSAYFDIPFIALFGLNEQTTRAANLASGIVSLWVFYYLVRRLADAKVALWAVFLLAICPWHVMMSRWALESNLLPGVFLLAVWFLLKGTERPKYFLLASLCFALSLYAYGTAYFAVPVFLFLASAYVLWKRRITWRVYGLGVALFALLATPMAAVIWANQKQVQSFRLAGIGIPKMPTVARYKTVSSVFGRQFLKNCLQNLSTLWDMIVKQDDGRFWNVISGQGLVFTFGMGFALIGLLGHLPARQRPGTFRPRVIMGIWFLTALLLAAIQDGNVNRLNILWMPIIYFAAVGLRMVAQRRAVAAGLVVVHLVLFTVFAATYFGPYRDRTASAFFPSFGKAIHAASQAVAGKICVTNSPCFAYSFVLFHERIDPREFAKTVVYENDGGEFQGVSSFGRYTFGTEHCPEDAEAYVVDNGDVDRFRDRAADIKSFSNYTAIVRKGK